MSRLPRWVRPVVAMPMQQCVRAADWLHDEEHRAKDAAVYVLAARIRN
jgi:hypothetical protein